MCPLHQEENLNIVTTKYGSPFFGIPSTGGQGSGIEIWRAFHWDTAVQVLK